MKSKKIKYTYSRIRRKAGASRGSLRSTLAVNKGICGAEFPVKEPSPSHFQHERTMAVHMMDVPMTRTSSSAEASSQRTLHALTPPSFDYTQYMESSFDESSHADCKSETIEHTSNAPNGVDTQPKESKSSHYQHDENREKYLPSFLNTQDDHIVLPPPTPPNMRPDFSQWGSHVGDIDLQVETIIQGCEKIEKDCQAGNLPENVVNRAKYLWKMLSQAAADFNYLHSDETMNEVSAVLVACCIYIACHQCRIPRTFIAIRVLTETSSLEFRQPVRRSFEFIQKYINETKCSCLRAFRVPSDGCCQICHRLYKKDVVSRISEALAFCIECSGAYHMSCVTSLNATIATPNPSDLICRRCVPCIVHPDVDQNPEKPTERRLTATRNSVSDTSNDVEKIEKSFELRYDRSPEPELVRKELKANSINSEMIKWLMKRCRNLQKRQDEDIAKVLDPVPRDFLAQIEHAESATIKILKMNYQATRKHLSKAQEVYLGALQTEFLQFNLQSKLQSFLERLQQTNSNASGFKRDRSILDPSDETCEEFKAALVSCHSKGESDTESSAEYAESSSEPRRGDLPQHSQVTSTGYLRSPQYLSDSELEEYEIQDYPELRFRKFEPGMRLGQPRKAKRAKLVMQEQMTQGAIQTAAAKQSTKQELA